MEISYKTNGVCSRSITLEIEDGIVKNVKFLGGCNGNTKGLAALVEGMPAKEVVKRLEGIKCGFKNTSCPDQLTRAIKEYLPEGD